MDLSDLEAEIGLLLSRMDEQPEDRRELYLQLRERLNAMRAYGMPVPDDLLTLERRLEAEFAAETPGTERTAGKKKGPPTGGPSKSS